VRPMRRKLVATSIKNNNTYQLFIIGAILLLLRIDLADCVDVNAQELSSGWLKLTLGECTEDHGKFL
jgi:hypothetical protein